MSTNKVAVLPTETLLHRLVAHDVDYIFINSGTDHPALIESIAKCEIKGQKIPEIVNCPHENAAMGLAHGYYFATQKSQAVIVHTNVGLANASMAMINASCNNIPTLVFSGRTPISEKGHFGSRNTPIGYGQEMRDQAAYVREMVKWDFELRLAYQMGDHIDRAYAIANSLPKGPVYLSLPREPLCDEYEVAERELYAKPQMKPTNYQPLKADIDAAATLIIQAKHPVIFAQQGVGSEKAVQLLTKLANNWGIPVLEFWATELSISSNDAMCAGSDPKPWLEQADLIIIIDSLAPWVLKDFTLNKNCKFIQMGPDPLFSKYPVRGYPIDVSLAGMVDQTLSLLLPALEHKTTAAIKQNNQTRHLQVKTINEKNAKQRREFAASGNGSRVSKAFFSQAVGAIAEKYDGIVASELAVAKEYTGLTRYNSYYQEALSGGLGEILPIALGIQLANRDRLVIAALGDGSYMFGNPVACHQIAEAMKLPILIVVANNAKWGAVENGVKALYPDGYAQQMKEMPAVSLFPSPDFAKIAAASNGLGIQVNHGDEVAAALERAVAFIKQEKRFALVEVPYW